MNRNKPLRQIDPLQGYHPEVGRWLSALEDARHRTKRSLEGITPSMIDWDSSAGGNSIGSLLYHVAAIEMDWLHTEILEGKNWPSEMEQFFPYNVRDDIGRLTPVRGESLEKQLVRLDRVRKHFLESIHELSLDEFRRPREFENYVVTPEWVIHHLMQHEAEHRGEIGRIVADLQVRSGTTPR